MLDLQDISLAFDHHPVLKKIDLHVNAGEIMCLLGPSGCGKTTLLRVIAGLEQADSGRILVNGQSIQDKPVHTRNFGFMFQDYALFPHLNVAQNITFGLKMHGQSNQQQRLREVIRLIGLEGFEKRDIAQLSGGEKQRVALARSLALEPGLLMLDEPLGSLDAALRERLVGDVKQIIKQIGLTAIYVTHDQSEAFAIADRIAVMNAGQIDQVDEPQAIFNYPRTEFVANFLGLNNVIPVLGKTEKGVRTPLGEFPVQGVGDKLLVHPLSIEFSEAGSIPMTVSECLFRGETFRLSFIHASGITLSHSISANFPNIPNVGDQVRITIHSDRLVLLSASPTNASNSSV